MISALSLIAATANSTLAVVLAALLGIFVEWSQIVGLAFFLFFFIFTPQSSSFLTLHMKNQSKSQKSGLAKKHFRINIQHFPSMLAFLSTRQLSGPDKETRFLFFNFNSSSIISHLKMSCSQKLFTNSFSHSDMVSILQ